MTAFLDFLKNILGGVVQVEPDNLFPWCNEASHRPFVEPEYALNHILFRLLEDAAFSADLNKDSDLLGAWLSVWGAT